MAETFSLTNGVKIPCTGFTTADIPASDTAQAVKNALRDGYRLIETAQEYGNEAETGAGIRSSETDRSDVFLITSIRKGLESKDEAAKAIDESIAALDAGAVDLMLLEAPDPFAEKQRSAAQIKKDKEVWQALEDALEAGKVHAIGISNFLQEDVDSILEDCKVPPMVNTARVHIGKTPAELIKYCQDKNIQILAYSPMGEGRLLKDNEIKAIADKYGVTPAQVCLTYDIQLGTVPLARANKEEYQKENVDLHFELSDDEMKTLGAMRDK